MLTTTLSLLRAHVGRLLAASLAIVIGVAFVAATIVVTASLRSSLEVAVAAQARSADVVVTVVGGEDADLTSQLSRVRAVDGVRAVAPMRADYADVDWPSGTSLTHLQTLPDSPELRLPRLISGVWPTATDEVAIDRTTAARSRLEPGASVTLRPDSGAPVALTVVGLVELPSTLEAEGQPTVLAAAGDIGAWTGIGATELLVLADPGTTPEQLRDRIAAAVPADSPAGLTVRTGAQQAQQELTDFSGGTDVLAGVLFAFAAIALFVAAMVIANTFRVMIAQRARQLALLRCVGATRRQVFASVLFEAALFGGVGSVVGAALGIGVGALAVTVAAGSDTDLPLTELTVPLVGPLAAVAVGVLTTLVAAAVPARSATRVRPVAALRTPAATVGGVVGKGRAAAGAMLGLLGFAACAFGASSASYPITVLGGLISAVGVLLASRVLVTAMLRVLRRPVIAVAGAPGRLADANLARDPRRVATTSTALMVGVTLIATLLVGMASTQATLANQLDASYPVDAEVVDTAGRVDDRLLTELAEIPGITRTATLSGSTVTVAGQPRPVLGVDDAAVQISRGTASDPMSGEVIVPPAVARNNRVSYGDTLQLSTPAVTLDLRVRLGTAEVASLLITRADLLRLDPAPAPKAVWLEAAPQADAAGVVEDIRETIDTVGSSAILNGTLRLRDAYEQVLGVATLVALGLLTVSVAIAGIGIANTLTLSVIERTKESALLRALGLTRAQLRATLVWEAVQLAMAASLIGIALGTGYGLAGTYSLLSLGPQTVPAVPIGQLLALVVVAMAVAALAALLPARRAARIAPAAALAQE